MSKLAYKDIRNYALDGMERVSEGTYGADLHNELFNTDYFIIGTYEAKKWLETHPGVFEAIEEIKEYEQDNFGQVSTDLSDPEKVVNMFAYIEGEKLLQGSKTLQKKWDDALTAADLKKITAELKAVKVTSK